MIGEMGKWGSKKQKMGNWKWEYGEKRIFGVEL